MNKIRRRLKVYVLLILYGMISFLKNIDDTHILEYSLSISRIYITGCTCNIGIVFGEFFISLTVNGELQGFEEWGIITLVKSDNDWQLFSDELPTGLVI